MIAEGRRGASGFTLIELLVALAIMGVLAAVAAIAVSGFDSVGVGEGCRVDTARLRKAETTYFLAHGSYADEAKLVEVGLLAEPSDLHDVGVMAQAYAVTEVGACIGRNSTYGIPAPTVGSTTHSGTTVSVVAADGAGVSGVAVAYLAPGDITWSSMGTTGASGSVNAPLGDGVYDLRVSLDGAVNTLSQVTVVAGTVVTFPTVELTVRLRNALGAGVAGGGVSVRSSGGSFQPLGSTPISGDLVTQVLPAAYDVSLTYGSMSSTRIGVTVNAPTAVSFELCTASVVLRSVTGVGIAGGVVSATPPGGATISLGTTDASGHVGVSLLSGTYDITMRYAGMTSVQSVGISGNPTITFQMVTVTVHMATSTGAALTGGDAATWYRPAGVSAWTSVGTPNASGNAMVDVLPATYDVEAQWFGVSSVQSSIAVSVPTTVTFQTAPVAVRMLASTGSALTGQDAAVFTRIAGNVAWTLSGTPNGSGVVSLELFPGNYDIRARWFGVFSVQPAVAVGVSAPTTVTFQTTLATLRMLASTGAGLSGQDAALFVREAGTSSWMLSAHPDAAGVVPQELFAATYDVRARWFGVFSVQSAVVVSAPTVVTFQTKLATLRMIASTGAGLTGQDGALFVRESGTTVWTLSGYPDGTGTVTQELFAATYDIEARWFAVNRVQPGVVVSGPTTVTFQTTLATLRMVASTGAGLTGQDSGFWLRQSSTSTWLLSGYPDASGAVAQELFAATYDIEARWFGVFSVQPGVVVSAPTVVTFQTKPATLRMLASTGAGLTGQDGALFVRQSGTTPWLLAGAPDGSGTLAQELFAATYDIEARWIAVNSVQPSVVVSGPTSVTFQTKLTTLRMVSSTGTGLSGQDEALWVRQSGVSSWYFLANPSAGTLTQELFAATYDVRSKWFGVFNQQSSVAVSGPTTVTFTSVPLTLRMLASTGGGLTGQDEAMWVRQTATSPYFFLGAPAVDGSRVQELFAATYDAKFRWTGATTTMSSNVVGGATTVSVSAVPVVATCRKQSDNSVVVGATGSIVFSGTVYPFGTTDASGVFSAQVLAGPHDLRCKLGALVGNNTNVNVATPAGAITTILMA